ncbi:hypothetical protein [Kineosporia babensis]|uniref:Uncharacterized protein n=1 Tax=Kineosporia babensis TaxID=499548 RepID=A0A9X1SY37_9ACTN|nr:hypothetical protein [Kineosporia babensis]MCD5316842.1 hypothetical protein [Kineosporia babensis]
MTRYVEPVVNTYWAPTGAEAEAVGVDPIVLAQQAKEGLRLPKPRLARSPSGSGWVNEYLWVWLESSWEEKEATASTGGGAGGGLGAQWATVTARPREMVIRVGSESVSCAGPGRAWRLADGAGVPDGDGCAVMVSESGRRVEVSVEVPYEVSWTGSGGSGGDLGVLTASANQTITVLESVTAGVR